METTEAKIKVRLDVEPSVPLPEIAKILLENAIQDYGGRDPGGLEFALSAPLKNGRPGIEEDTMVLLAAGRLDIATFRVFLLMPNQDYPDERL